MIWTDWQVWLAIAMVLVLLEIFVPGFVLACLGFGALGGALVAGCGGGMTAQLAVAGGFGLLSFLFLRPLAQRLAFTGKESVSGVEAILGRECRVSIPFHEGSGMGRCKIDGDDWRAQLNDRTAAPTLKTGDAVWIERVESNTLIVSTTPIEP